MQGVAAIPFRGHISHLKHLISWAILLAMGLLLLLLLLLLLHSQLS
jgi:hypothetical protein